MIKKEWDNLKVEDRVKHFKGNLFLNVVEICEEERFLKQWKARGHPEDIKRIIKLEGDHVEKEFCYHSWAVSYSDWDIV